MEDLLASFYHYLQFGYYKMGDIEKAAEAAASFLQILPDHQDMLGNLDYYQTVEGVRNIKPREEAVEYMEREDDEHSLLDYITDNFVFSESEDNDIEEENEHEEHDSVSDNTKKEKDLEEDEFVAKWSEEEQQYILEDKEENIFTDVKLTPPPIVKFSW